MREIDGSCQHPVQVQVDPFWRHFQRVLVKRSRSEPLIQVADLVAGATLRRDAKGEAEAFGYIEKKLMVVEYRA